MSEFPDELPNECQMRDVCTAIFRLRVSRKVPAQIRVPLIKSIADERAENLLYQRACEGSNPGRCLARWESLAHLRNQKS